MAGRLAKIWVQISYPLALASVAARIFLQMHVLLFSHHAKVWHLLKRLLGVACPLFALWLPFRLWREVGRLGRAHLRGLVFPGSPIASLFDRIRTKGCSCAEGMM